MRREKVAVRESNATWIERMDLRKVTRRRQGKHRGNRQVNRNRLGGGGVAGRVRGRRTGRTLSDYRGSGMDREKSQCFRVRADVFASAHGRPDGVPGRIVGARAKGLRGTARNWWTQRRDLGF